MRKPILQISLGSLLTLIAVNFFIFLSHMDFSDIAILLPLIVTYLIMRNYMIYVYKMDSDDSMAGVITAGSFVFAISSLIEATIIYLNTKNMYSAVLFAFCMFFSETWSLLEKIFVTKKYQISQIFAHAMYILQAMIITLFVGVMVLFGSHYLEYYLLLAVLCCIVTLILIVVPKQNEK